MVVNDLAERFHGRDFLKRLAMSYDDIMDITDPDMAYLFGFLQTDGTLSRGTGRKGRVSVEVNSRDSWIVDFLHKTIPAYSSTSRRKRDTNFKKNVSSVSWRAYDIELREALRKTGLPEGRKHLLVAIPKMPFSEADYFRGLIDGNGSIGFTSNRFPFVSFNTASKALAHGYIDFVFKVTGKRKTTSRNKRDGTFNIAVFKEDAVVLASKLYYPGASALPRKARLANSVTAWRRPSTMRRVDARRRWLASEDAVVMSVAISEASRLLKRSKKSVVSRRQRLKSSR